MSLSLLLAAVLALPSSSAVTPIAGRVSSFGLSAAARVSPVGVPVFPFTRALAPAPTGFGWPLAPGRVSRRFDPPPRPWLAGHRGVDLAGMPSQVVVAAGTGTVVYAGVIAGRGVVSVAHAGGLRTTYEPVVPSVRVGDAVGGGTGVGTLAAGHPGCPEPACLHWGLRRGDVYLDPLVLLGLGRVRLLPLRDRP